MNWHVVVTVHLPLTIWTTSARKTKLTTNYKNENHLEHFEKNEDQTKLRSRKLGPKKYLSQKIFNN